MFNVSKLRGRMIEVFGTIGAFADAAGCSRAYVSKYLHHKATLDQKTIRKWVDVLNICETDISEYFFALEVNEMEH